MAGRRRPVPGARHGRRRPVRRADAGARQAQHPRRAREAAAPDGDARCGFPPAGYLKRALGHGDLRARPRQDLRRRRLRGVLAPGLGQVDGGVPGHQVLRRDDGVTASEMTHGWVHPKNVYYDVAPSVQKADNYGGFMIWDRYRQALQLHQRGQGLCLIDF